MENDIKLDNSKDMEKNIFLLSNIYNYNGENDNSDWKLLILDKDLDMDFSNYLNKMINNNKKIFISLFNNELFLGYGNLYNVCGNCNKDVNISTRLTFFNKDKDIFELKNFWKFLYKKINIEEGDLKYDFFEKAYDEKNNKNILLKKYCYYIDKNKVSNYMYLDLKKQKALNFEINKFVFLALNMEEEKLNYSDFFENKYVKSISFIEKQMNYFIKNTTSFPLWSENIKKIIEINKNIEKLKKGLNKKKIVLEELNKTKKQELLNYEYLWSDGKNLEKHIIDILKKNINKIKELEKKDNEDFVFTNNDKDRYILEIKGTKKTILEKHISQLVKFMATYNNSNNNNYKNYAVLIINNFKDLDINKRELEYNENILQRINNENFSISIITTKKIFNLLENNKKNELINLFKKNGIHDN